MVRIILIDGKLTKEKRQQILKRYGVKEGRETKATLADVWPKEKDGYGGNRPSDA